MIIGVGTDLIEISRIRDSIQRFHDRFIQRIFTDLERQKSAKYADPAPYFAKRFAAKEACFKACGFGIGQGAQWLDVEISATDLGQPLLLVSGQTLAFLCQRHGLKSPPNFALSLTDSQEMAQAFVILSQDA